MKTDFSEDIYRYQKIIDPIAICCLFIQSRWNEFDLEINKNLYFLFLGLIIYYIMNFGNIYINLKKINFFKSFIRVLYFSTTITFALVGVDSLLHKDIYTNEKIGIFFIFCNLYVYFSHVLLIQIFRLLKSLGLNNQNILYFGGYKSVNDFIEQNKNNSWLGYNVKTWFSPFKEDKGKILNDKIKCQGDIDAIDAFLKDNRIDLILYSMETDENNNLDNTLFTLGDKSIPVCLNPYWARKSMSIKQNFIGKSLCIDLWNSNLTFTDKFFKRIMDLVLGILFLIIFSPIFIISSIIIKLSTSGPIIFKQARYGLSGNKFFIYKFRSMTVEEKGDLDNLKSATINDSRFYPFGRFMRRFSIDELPQLFNVIEGSMSLVGPRPHAVNHNERYRKLVPGYMQRHNLKPGITGLAQINGLRGEIKNLSMMEKRVNADLMYLNNWSIKLDLKILLRTFFNIYTNQSY